MEINWTALGIVILLLLISYLFGRLHGRGIKDIPADIVDLYKGLQDLPQKVLQVVQGSISEACKQLQAELTNLFIEVKSGQSPILTEEEIQRFVQAKKET